MKKNNENKINTISLKKDKQIDYSQKIFGKAIQAKAADNKDKNTSVKLSAQKTSAQTQKENEIIKLKKEIADLKAENFNMRTISALEKSGCLKAELAAKVIPKDCTNIQEWVDNFKSENDILFQQPAQSHGSAFKPSQCSNLSPVEIMNNYIRGI